MSPEHNCLFLCKGVENRCRPVMYTLLPCMLSEKYNLHDVIKLRWYVSQYLWPILVSTIAYMYVYIHIIMLCYILFTYIHRFIIYIIYTLMYIFAGCYNYQEITAQRGKFLEAIWLIILSTCTLLLIWRYGGDQCHLFKHEWHVRMLTLYVHVHTVF